MVTLQATIPRDHGVGKIVGGGEARKRIRWATSPSFLELSRGISIPLWTWFISSILIYPKEAAELEIIRMLQ